MDSIWNNSSHLSVGDAGTGTLNITSDARVHCDESLIVSGSLNVTNAFVGSDRGSIGPNGAALIDGSTWHLRDQSVSLSAPSNLVVFGILEVINGGRIEGGSPGELSVNGSLIINQGNVDVDRNEITNVGGELTVRGTIQIDDGSLSNDFDTRIQEGGIINVNGPNSRWTSRGNADMGELHVGGELHISNGAIAVSTLAASYIGRSTGIATVDGVVSGDGDFDTNVENAGLVSPGSTTGALHLDENYTQSPGGELLIELATASDFDQLLVTGTATLAGKLHIDLLDGFIPSAGESFTILTADDLDGTFNTVAFPTVPNIAFDVIYNAQSIVLQVLAAALPGDYNIDGTVDAADYVVWRKNPDGFGGSAGYDTWRTNFGRTAANGPAAPGSAAGSNLLVPEPYAATLILALLSAAAFLRWPNG